MEGTTLATLVARWPVATRSHVEGIDVERAEEIAEKHIQLVTNVKVANLMDRKYFKTGDQISVSIRVRNEQACK